MELEYIQELLKNGWVRYGIIIVLSFILYKLGFERPLPPLKKLVVYIFLVIGCFPLVVLYAFGLPIIPALLAAIALMVVVRIRERFYRKDGNKEGSNVHEVK